MLEGYVRLRAPMRTIGLVTALKEHLNSLLQAKIDRPELSIAQAGGGDGDALLDAIASLLQSEDGYGLAQPGMDLDPRYDPNSSFMDEDDDRGFGSSGGE